MTAGDRALLRYKAAVDATDAQGWTPLMCSAWDSHLEVCDTLIKAHANTTLVDQRGMTALSHAASRGQSAVVDRLLRVRSPGVNLADMQG